LLVELDAMRVACPARRRLAGVILGLLSKSIPAFYPIRSPVNGSWATETDLKVHLSGRVARSGCKSPQGVRGPLDEGSFNFGWRGESGARESFRPGTIWEPGVRLKRPAANSSTMRGGKGASARRYRLPVIFVGDGAELRRVLAEWVRGSL
jgi:hypothetical protein